MNQMWVEIGLNAFQINSSDDSRYANDQYHIFWQFRSYASNANMANVIWYLTGKLYYSAKTLLFVSLVLILTILIVNTKTYYIKNYIKRYPFVIWLHDVILFFTFFSSDVYIFQRNKRGMYLYGYHI